MPCVRHDPYCHSGNRCIWCLMAKPKPDPAMDRAVERAVESIKAAFKNNLDQRAKKSPTFLHVAKNVQRLRQVFDM